MINLVYIDDQMFSTDGSTYEDILDVWLHYLRKISCPFELYLFDDSTKCIDKLNQLANNTIILLDIQMDLKDTNGAKVLKEIRDNQITCPVIGYSANKNTPKNDPYLISLLENDLFDYVLKNASDFTELINSINKAIEKFKDNIPLELSEALQEYLERNPEFKDMKVTVKDSQEYKEVSFEEIQRHLNEGTIFGKDYQKAIYKIAFEDFKEKRKVIG